MVLVGIAMSRADSRTVITSSIIPREGQAGKGRVKFNRTRFFAGTVRTTCCSDRQRDAVAKCQESRTVDVCLGKGELISVVCEF